MEKIILSIVIPTKNRITQFIKCVESINKQSCLPEELIIVDQSNRADCESQIRQLVNKAVSLIYIYNPTLSGLTMARNVGISYSSGDLILFLDDDAILLESALMNLKNIFRNDDEKSIGGLGLAIKNHRSPLIGRLDDFIFYYGPFRGNRYFDYFQRNYRKLDLRLFKSFHIGGLACYRREVFSDFKFDNNLSGYSFGEDYMFGYCVSKKYNTFLSSAVEVIHERSGFPRTPRVKFMGMYVIFWFYVFYKYCPKTFYNVICYLMVNISQMLRLIKNIFSPHSVFIIISSYREIGRVLIRRQSVEELVKQRLS